MEGSHRRDLQSGQAHEGRRSLQRHQLSVPEAAGARDTGRHAGPATPCSSQPAVLRCSLTPSTLLFPHLFLCGFPNLFLLPTPLESQGSKEGALIHLGSLGGAISGAH